MVLFLFSVRPDAPEIIEQPTIATREGELVRAACQSRHGNPPPKFKWSFSNKTDIPDDWQRVTNASRTDQPTISRIEYVILCILIYNIYQMASVTE
jgi:hypothetical protein